MRTLILSALLVGTTIADPCTDLCIRDGPSVCTNGSWTQPGGSCFGYVYRGEPFQSEYCYHTPLTAVSCPAKNKQAVRADHVYKLVQEIETFPVRSAPVPTETPFINVKSTGALHFGLVRDRGMTFRRNIWIENAGRFEAQARVLVQSPNNLISAALGIDTVSQFPRNENVSAIGERFRRGPTEWHTLMQCFRSDNRERAFAFFALSAGFFEDIPYPQDPEWFHRFCSMLATILSQLETI